MKLARRAFLQFAAGAVGGTLLSPIPWKLADDSAIWSQNWSWRPSPERGHVTKTPTTCLLCEGGCGIQAHLVNGNRAIFIEGNPLNPINQGGVCPLSASGLQFLYAPYRVPQPLRQTKERGDLTGFEPIGWEEAISELSIELKKLRSQAKTNALAAIIGRPRSSMAEMWRQFFKAFGSPNLYPMPSHEESLELAALLTTGAQQSLAFTLEKASYVLSFGADLVGGWGVPARMQAIFGRWREEKPGAIAAEIIQIEPRCSLTAAKADQWIPIKPGSQAALALGIAHVMIKENLFDQKFVADHVFGFEDWTDENGKSRQGFKKFVLSEYSPAKVSELTGVDATRIQELGEEFGRQKKAVAVWGEGDGKSPNNIYDDLVFMALNVLKGNFKSDGMISFTPPVPLAALPEVEMDEPARKGLEQPRLDQARGDQVPLPGTGLYGFLDAVGGASPYPIDCLMVYEANPVYSMPENQLVKKAFQKVGKIVSFSSYMDETAVMADLILPNHTALERFDDIAGLAGVPYPYYAVSTPILPPQLQTMHSGDVVIAMAKKLGGTLEAAFPWENYEEYLKFRVNGLAESGAGAVCEEANVEPWNLKPGQSPETNYDDGEDLWEKLTSGLCWYGAPSDPLAAIATASGKYELACVGLQKHGVVVDEDQIYLPHYAPLLPSGDKKEFPLLLVSYNMLSLANGYLANPPFMTKTLWDFLLKGKDLFVEINPKTAKSLGMKEGDQAILKTPRGEVRVRVHIFPGAHPEAIFMVKGLGHTAYDEYIQGKGVNTNDVMEVQMDPVTGLGTVWATRAQLVRV